MAFSIRAGSRADADAIEHIRRVTWHTTYNSILNARAIDGATQGFADRWRRDFKPDGGQFVFIAESAGKPVGFILGGPSREAWADYPGEIYLLYVLDEFQRQGIGKQLMIKAHEALSAAKLAPYFLFAIGEVKAPQAFYTRAGGKDITRSKGFSIAGTPLTDIAFGWTMRPFGA